MMRRGVGGSRNSSQESNQKGVKKKTLDGRLVSSQSERLKGIEEEIGCFSTMITSFIVIYILHLVRINTWIITSMITLYNVHYITQ